MMSWVDFFFIALSIFLHSLPFSFSPPTSWVDLKCNLMNFGQHKAASLDMDTDIYGFNKSLR